MSGIEVITEDLQDHPQCPHGPTILFSRLVSGQPRNFFACSACRDKKDCTFFLWQDERNNLTKVKQQARQQENDKFIANVDHKKLLSALSKVKKTPVTQRIYCRTCDKLDIVDNLAEHSGHCCKEEVTNYELSHPSELLLPLENPKMEAQFLFSKVAVKTIVGILANLQLSNVVCIGAPRIHEYILEKCPKMRSILLDIDKRYHNFFDPKTFCWYNSFNNHFFFNSSRSIFENFLKTNSGAGLALLMDPPFGGRVEPLAQTVKTIESQYQDLNSICGTLPVFWVFPYFMEPQIRNSLPQFEMMDYKVEYDNHPLFRKGPKGRKQGSPVRIFTNVDLRLIVLPPEQGYKHCKVCEKWVSIENQHCSQCKACTSKDGRTYVHCEICNRCVKPTWQHCNECQKCAQTDHKCGEELCFEKECFHCHERGHKKRDCPKVDHQELRRKRKEDVKKQKKKIKCS